MWAPAFLGLAYPYILFSNLFFILFWLFAKPIYSLISVLTILVGYSHTNNYFQFSKSTTEEPGLDLVSYNVQGFFGASKGTVKQQVLRVVEFLETQEADVICLQEASYAGRIYSDWKEEFRGKKLPKYGITKGGQVIMSNYRIINSKKQDFEGTGNNFMYADLLIEGDTVRVYNCHLQSYAFTNRDIGLLDSIHVEERSVLVKDAELYMGKLKKGFIKRTEQAKVLRQSIDDSPYRVIVCGDFNDTPVSYSYRTIIGKDLSDAFTESGSGTGNSYRGRLPSFRIDYIFYDDAFKAYNFKTVDVEYSDHYPIKCRLIKQQD